MSQDISSPAAPAAVRSGRGKAGAGKSAARRRVRALSPEERARQIVEAARAVFVEKGFADARIDDVARRAGVAKGTVYLHFASKEELFKAVVRAAILPAVGHLEQILSRSEASTEELLRGGLRLLTAEVLGTDRRHILRLVLTEGHRFPEIAGFYHAEVVGRGFALVRRVLERGRARGEVSGDALIRFPQLLVAPAMLAILWEGLFGAEDPLDAEALMQAHLEVILKAIQGGGS